MDLLRPDTPLPPDPIPDPAWPTTGARLGHPDRLRRPPYVVSVVGPPGADPGFVERTLCRLLVAKLSTHRVELRGELGCGGVGDGMQRFGGPRGIAPAYFVVNREHGRHAAARLAVLVVGEADALVLFDDGTRGERFQVYSWLAGKCGLRCEVVRLPVKTSAS